MCGLVGMITKLRNGFNQENTNIFDQLLYLNALRGLDSTGAFVVNNIGNVTLAKEAKQSAAFMASPEYKKLKTDAVYNGWAMIGHSRRATKGSVTDKNAHPFVVDKKIVLVHNGSMWGDHKHLKDVEVDSEAIAHTLAADDDVEKQLQKINAAYALIWYNVAQKRLNFIRNDQRPLAWLETSNAWYFASEGGMLQYVINRNNVPVYDNMKITDFVPRVLNTWDLEKDKSSTLGFKELDSAYKPTPAKREIETDSWPAMENDLDAPEPELTRIIIAANQETIEEERAAQAPVMPLPAAPDNAKIHTFSDFTKLKDVYKTGMKIKVIVTSWLNEEYSHNFMMMEGRVQDGNDLYAVFPLDKKILSAITDGQTPHRNFTFSVEVDKLGWRRVVTDHKAVTDMGPMEGRITIMARNAKLHLDSTGRRVQ